MMQVITEWIEKMGMQTVWDHIRLAADRTPSHIAVVDDQSARTLTFTDLIYEVECVAAGLAAVGLKPGQHVGTVLPNVLQHVIAILALHRLGAIVCMINPRLKPNEAGQLIADARMSGVLCVADEGVVTAARAVLPEDAPILVVGGPTEGDCAFEKCRGDGAELPDWMPPDPEDPILSLENVILAPHALAWTDQLFAAIGRSVIESVLSIKNGIIPENSVNRDVLQKPIFRQKLEQYHSRS